MIAFTPCLNRVLEKCFAEPKCEGRLRVKPNKKVMYHFVQIAIVIKQLIKLPDQTSAQEAAGQLGMHV